MSGLDGELTVLLWLIDAEQIVVDFAIAAKPFKCLGEIYFEVHTFSV
jgi:hypothetical protein